MFFFIILFSISTSFIRCAKIHELMTDKEIVEIFGTPPTSVPEYDVVPIAYSFNEKTAEHKVKTKFFGQYIVLDLSPVKEDLNSKYTKIWKGRRNESSPTGVSFTYLGEAHSVHVVSKLHHDVKRSASLIVNKDKDYNLLLDGMIEGNLAIRSLPERLRPNLRNSRSDFNFTDVPNEDLKISHSHVIYQIPKSEKKFENVTENPISAIMNIQMETFHPEIMVVMDEILFGRFNHDVLKAVEYLIMFWHGVDMKFRSLVKPEFHLSLVQIVLMNDTMPFIKQSNEEGNVIKTNEAIELMREYFYKEDQLGQFHLNEDYDLAMFMTSYDLSFKTSNGWDRKVHGVAHIGGACRKKKNMVLATGILEDNGGFRGLLTGFHELGHLLGAEHDGTRNTTAEKCSVKHGYIMGAQSGMNMFYYSKCSVEAIQNHEQSGKSACMKNPPPVKHSLPKNSPSKYIIPLQLPGKYLNLKEQCNGNKPCYVDARVCLNLCCDNNTKFKFWNIPLYGKAPAADGSPCGNGRFCVNGFCIGLSTVTAT